MPDSTPNILSEADLARVARIRDQKFLNYSAALKIFAELEQIYSQPTSHRPQNYLLTAETGNGKTFLLSEFLSRYPGSDSAAAEALEMPIVMVQAPPKGNLRLLYTAILDKLHVVYSKRSSNADLFDLCLKMVRACKVKLIIIDEFHTLVSSRGLIRDSVADFLNMLKYILNELKIPMVCAGIPLAETVAKLDEQIWDRFEFGDLPLWKSNTQSTINLLKSLETSLELTGVSDLTSPETRKYLISTSKGHLGRITRMVRECGHRAVGNSERVTLAELKPYWDKEFAKIAKPAGKSDNK